MKTFQIIIIFLLATQYLVAQKITAMRDSVSGSYNFWLYEPSTPLTTKDTVRDITNINDTDTTIFDDSSTHITSDSLSANLTDSSTITVSKKATKPLFIFLHGRSLSGNDLQIVRRYGTISALEMGLELDAYVLAPQTSNGWNAARIWKMVEWTISHYPIDTTRIYALGMSMGGYGTLDLAAAYPNKIAAAIALCGGATTKELCGLCELPLWIIHGTADKQVSVKCSDKVVAAMVNCGDTTRLRYDPLQGQNHSILARVFYMYEAYDWLLAHSLNDSARVVNRDYEITTAKLGTAYKHLHGKKRHITMVNGTKTSDTYTQGAPAIVHIVKQGDTLYGIARKHGTTVSKLCQINGISETSILRIGQKIKLTR